MKALLGFFLKNRLFGDMLSLFLIVVGVASALLIKREIFPNVSFDIITITTIFPGSSPLETEKLITTRLEQDLQEVDGIKKMRSTSSEGRSAVVIMLDPDQTTEDEAKSDITDVTDAFDPPQGSEDPLVTVLKSKQQPIIEVSLSSKLDPLKFREVARQLERELELNSGIAKIVFKGLDDLEIRVEPLPARLLQLNVTIPEIISALEMQNFTIPAGVIEDVANKSGTKEKIVRTVGEFQSLLDVGNTVIRSNELGQPIRVKDVASVYQSTARPTVLNRTNGQPSISLTVLKKEQADAITVVDSVKEITQNFMQKATDVSVSYINDFSTFIRRRLSILTTNMLVGLVLVTLILTLFLPWRIALIAVAGIAISFFGTMWFFYIQGYSINLISLLGLIIVSGMLVDDAVVVSDNIVRHMEEGEPAHEAALNGAIEIWPAITASVLTTVTAFLPMMFMSGIFGKFVKQIPLGVVTALLFSLFEALLLLPQHMATYVRTDSLKLSPDSRSPRAAFQSFWDGKVVPLYGRVIERLIHRRWLMTAFTGLFFVGSIFVARQFLPFILFPPEGIETFFIRVKAPTGYSLANTLRTIQPIEKAVAELPSNELMDYVTTVGLIQQDPNDPNTKRGSEYAQIAVFLTPETDRDRTALQVIEYLKSSIQKPDDLERMTFERVNPGPPTGKPISIGIRGEEYEQILAAVGELKPLVANIEGAVDITDSYSPGKEEVQLIVDAAEAAAAGLTVAEIGNTVRAAFDGAVATSIQRLDEEVDIRVSFPEEDRGRVDVLEKIRVPNKRGYQVPLLQLAKTVTKTGVSVYEHEAGRREVRVLGEIDTSKTSAVAVASYVKENILPEFNKKFPNIHFSFGGEDEDTQESLISLVRAFGVAVMGIFLILVLTFKNITQPFLVLLTIPLGIIAVIWTLIVMGQPLSFLAGLGIVALSGVIVNNAIVLIDFVNIGRKEGLDRWESILRASKLRIRPIFLTSSTTVAGLIPTAHGIGGLDKFVVPIALSLGYGMLFGAILTAFFFPCAIAVLDDIKLFVGRKL